MRQETLFKKVSKEVGIKTGQMSYNDICTTCNHLDLCVGRKDRQRPIWFCEEFDDYVAVESAFKAPKPKIRTGATGLKGLCLNCENRDSCGFLKPNGGVWHCEEYK